MTNDVPQMNTAPASALPRGFRFAATNCGLRKAPNLDLGVIIGDEELTARSIPPWAREAMELFMDDVPTYGYFPSVYYYVGRVREGMHSAGFADSYRAYLQIREKAGEDPLLAEVRRRAGR